jgi:hypothetical protein
MKSHERLGEIASRLPIVQEKNIDKDRRRREAAAVKALIIPRRKHSSQLPLKAGIDDGSNSLTADHHLVQLKLPQQRTHSQSSPSASFQGTRKLKPATVDPIFVEAAINAARADVTGFTNAAVVPDISSPDHPKATLPFRA